MMFVDPACLMWLMCASQCSVHLCNYGTMFGTQPNDKCDVDTTLHGETWSCFWQSRDDEIIIAFDTSSWKKEIVVWAGG